MECFRHFRGRSISDHTPAQYRSIDQARLAAVEDQARLEAMQIEVEKLLKAGVIRELKYPTWLCSPVMVRKANVE